MAHFMVSYDLHRNRDYTRIINALREQGAARVLESLWFVSLSNTATQVRDWLKSYVDGDDSLIVVELKIGADWAGLRAQDAGVDWLRITIKA
jgi:hypothetical protein